MRKELIIYGKLLRFFIVFLVVIFLLIIFVFNANQPIKIHLMYDDRIEGNSGYVISWTGKLTYGSVFMDSGWRDKNTFTFCENCKEARISLNDVKEIYSIIKALKINSKEKEYIIPTDTKYIVAYIIGEFYWTINENRSAYEVNQDLIGLVDKLDEILERKGVDVEYPEYKLNESVIGMNSFFIYSFRL